MLVSAGNAKSIHSIGESSVSYTCILTLTFTRHVLSSSRSSYWNHSRSHSHHLPSRPDHGECKLGGPVMAFPSRHLFRMRGMVGQPELINTEQYPSFGLYAGSSGECFKLRWMFNSDNQLVWSARLTRHAIRRGFYDLKGQDYRYTQFKKVVPAWFFQTIHLFAVGT